MKYLLRFLWYWIKHLGVFLLLGFVLITAFFTAMDIGANYIVVKEALYRRASVVLLKEDAASLSKYFTNNSLSRDTVFTDNSYEEYFIRSFDHNVTIHSIWGLAWTNTVTLTVSEKIGAINGELPNDKKTPAQIAQNKRIAPPPWQNGKYRIVMKRSDGGWEIDELQLIELLPEKKPEISPSPAP